MNKKIGFVLFGFILSVFLISFVSAYYGGFSGGYLNLRQGSEQVINGAVDFAEPFLQAILGGETWSGELLFERLILFLIVASIVYLSISKIPPFKENKGVIWVITLAIPLLAVRWLDFEWLNAIIIQYQILGVVLTSILPFVIYFLFIEALDYGTLRKVGWILFIVIYYGLWSTTGNQTYNQFYFWTIIASLALLLFDKTIHRWYLFEKIRASGKTTVERAATAVRRKMVEAKQDLDHNIITRDVYNERMKDLEKDLKSIYKHSF